MPTGSTRTSFASRWLQAAATPAASQPPNQAGVTFVAGQRVEGGDVEMHQIINCIEGLRPRRVESGMNGLIPVETHVDLVIRIVRLADRVLGEPLDPGVAGERLQLCRFLDAGNNEGLGTLS
jgi:hypothetical protein